jgi:hypothetical protein
VTHPFIAGAQAMRELQAQNMEQCGDPVAANAMRRNWHDAWGDDPGTPADEPGSVGPENFGSASEWGPSATEIGTL